MRPLLACFAVTLATGLLTYHARGEEDWSQFRGPGGSGMSAAQQLPEKWSEQQNLVWRTKLPGLGSSSPIVVGQRVYLTCYSGYGLQPSEGDMNQLKRHLVCLNRGSGEILWTKTFDPALPESEYSGGNDSRHGYATSTPASDGKHLYVFFGKSGVYCLDLDGNPQWHTSVGDKTHHWGSGNSPVLFENLVIINASVESNRLVALDKQTGKQVWERPGIRSSWNTPVLVPLQDQPTELVVSIQRHILGIDPRTGEELWRCDGISTYVCPSPIAHEGVVYVTGGRGRQSTLAIRAGGRGDVTDSHLIWRQEKGSNVSSPVYHEGHVYCMNDSRGIAFCFRARDGELLYEQRLQPTPGLVYSSPLAADGKIYYVSQHKGTFVLAAKPQFELRSQNQFADDDSRTNAAPIVSNGQLLMRTDQYLYCLGS